MTALLGLLFALFLVVAATLWRSSRGGFTKTSQSAHSTHRHRIKRLWWPRIVTRPG